MRKQRSDKGVPRTQNDEVHTMPKNHPMPVTSARIEHHEPAQAQPVANGPTTGYRDGPNGTVHVADFPDGRRLDGWHDNPAKCDNCDGIEHPEYVKVKPDDPVIDR